MDSTVTHGIQDTIGATPDYTDVDKMVNSQENDGAFEVDAYLSEAEALPESTSSAQGIPAKQAAVVAMLDHVTSDGASNVEDSFANGTNSDEHYDKVLSEAVDKQHAKDANTLVEAVNQGDISATEAVDAGRELEDATNSSSPATLLYGQVNDGKQPPTTNEDWKINGQRETFRSVLDKGMQNLAVNTSNAEIIKEAALMAASPGQYTVTMNLLINAGIDALGSKELSDNTPTALLGDKLDYLSSIMRTSSEKDRIKVAKGIFSNVEKNNNPATMDALLLTMLLPQLQGEPLSAGENAFESIGGILDVVAAPIMGARAVNRLRKSVDAAAIDNVVLRAPGSTAADVVTEANPENAAKAKAAFVDQGIDTPEATAGGLNTQAIETEAILADPATTTATKKGRPELINALQGESTEAFDTALEIRGMYTNEEKAAVQARALHQVTGNDATVYTMENFKILGEDGVGKDDLVKIAQDLNNKEPTVKTDSEVTLQATYSSPIGEPGWSPVQAHGVALSKLGLNEGDYKLTARAKGSGEEYLVADTSRDSITNSKVTVIDGEGKHKIIADPEIRINMDWTYQYDKTDITTFGDKPILRGTGKSAWAVSNAYKVTKRIRDMFQIAHDKEKGLRTKLQSKLHPSLVKLNFDEGVLLGDVLRNNAGTSTIPGRRLTSDELRLQHGASQKVIDVYHSVRDTLDELYDIANATERKKKKARGVKEIIVDGHKEAIHAIPFTQKEYGSSEGILHTLLGKNGEDRGMIYDIAGDTVHHVKSVEDVDALLDQGWLLARAEGDSGFLKNAKEGYKTLMLDPRATKIQGLPTHVLRYNPGYLPKIYSNTYFVRVPKKITVNGIRRTVMTTVAAGDDLTEANMHARQYIKDKELDHVNSGGRSETFVAPKPVVEHAREIDMEDLQFTKAYNGGDSRAQHSDLPGATLEDPITAMHRSISAVSRKSTYGKVIENMEQRFLNQYGKFLKDPEDIGSGWKTSNFEGAAEAESFIKYLDAIKGVQDPFDSLVHRNLIRLAEFVEKNGWRTGAKVIRGAKDSAPASALKGATFTVLLGMNPLRHLIMQATQYTYLAGINPIMAGKATALGALLIKGRLTRTSNPAQYAKTLKSANSIGYSKDEFNAIMDNLENSGVMSSIDANMFMTEGLMDASTAISKTKGQYARRKIANSLKLAPRAMQKVGFNAGEYTNLALTYAFAHLRNAEKFGHNAVLDKDVVQDTAALTKSLALSPNSVGAFDFQKGALSFGTQFLGFQLKALELLLHGGETLTKAERRRMVYGQALLYGTTGLGIEQSVEYVLNRTGIKRTPETENLIRGGITDWTINALLNADEGDPDEQAALSITHSISPLFKVESVPIAIHDFIKYGSDPQLLGTLTGASGVMVGNIMGSIGLIHKIFSDPILDTDEKMLLATESMASIIPLLNNTTKSMWADRMGYTLSSRTYGQTVKNTTGELIAKGIFGVNSYKNIDYNASHRLSRATKQQKKALATDVAKVFNMLVLNLGDNVTPDTLSDAAKKASYLMVGMSKSERHEIFALAHSQLMDIGTPGMQTMLQFLGTELQHASGKDMIEYTNSVIQHNRAVPEHDKKNFAEIARTYKEGEDK